MNTLQALPVLTLEVDEEVKAPVKLVSHLRAKSPELDKAASRKSVTSELAHKRQLFTNNYQS
jgi:hypothetical protein